MDFPPQWTANNTNSTTPHQHLRDLSANHKAALAASVAEVDKYAGGVTHSLVFTPHLEVFHTGKVLVPGVEIKMKFHFNSPNLLLNGVALAGRLMEGDVKLRFHLCQLRLNETVYGNLSVQRHNAKQMATYPTVRSEIRTFSMQGNLTRFDIPNLFQNRVPDRLIVALVDSRNFNGDVTRDPFCFQKFGLSSIRQIVRGEEYPYETLRLAHNDATRDNLGYFRFLQASGAWCKKKGNMVELGDWGHEKNCTLFMFDNVANGCADSQRLNPKQTGDLQLSLEFGAAPNTNITCSCMVNLRTCWKLTRTEPCCTTFASIKKMEQVALNNVQLDYLARDDPQLKPVFYGTVACDRLPKTPRKNTPQGYIVNTDPHD